MALGMGPLIYLPEGPHGLDHASPSAPPPPPPSYPHQVWRALKDHGLLFLCLSDSARTGLGGGTAAVPGEGRRLLHAGPIAAAGANLTAASNMLFVHPMNAESDRFCGVIAVCCRSV